MRLTSRQEVDQIETIDRDTDLVVEQPTPQGRILTDVTVEDDTLRLPAVVEPQVLTGAKQSLTEVPRKHPKQRQPRPLNSAMFKVELETMWSRIQKRGRSGRDSLLWFCAIGLPIITTLGVIVAFIVWG